MGSGPHAVNDKNPEAPPPLFQVKLTPMPGTQNKITTFVKLYIFENILKQNLFKIRY